MNAQLVKIQKAFDARSQRERLCIVAAVLILVSMGWYNILYGYLLATDEEIARNLQKIQSQIRLLEGQIDTVAAVIGRDPTAVLAAQSKKLKAENARLSQDIRAYIQKMVTPSEMNAMLNNIIQKAIGMTVLSIENLEAKPIFSAKHISVNTKTLGFQVFDHGIALQLQGDYFATLQFLKTLEQQKMNMMWEKFQYAVTNYPEAKITIELNTLSLEEGWIGV